MVKTAYMIICKILKAKKNILIIYDKGLFQKKICICKDVLLIFFERTF